MNGHPVISMVLEHEHLPLWIGENVMIFHEQMSAMFTS